MRHKLKKILYQNLFVHLGLLVIRLLSSTYRLKLVDAAIESDIFERGYTLIYAS